MFFADLNILLGIGTLLTVGVLIDETITLILGIAITLQSLRLDAPFRQFELAFHDKHGEIFFFRTERICFDGVLGCNDARLVIASPTGTIAEIRAKIVIQLS